MNPRMVLVSLSLLMARVEPGWALGSDLQGAWVRDTTQSDPLERGRGSKYRRGRDLSQASLTLEIKQSESEIDLAWKGNAVLSSKSSRQKFRLDGTVTLNPLVLGRGRLKTKARWQDAKLVLEGTETTATNWGDVTIQIAEEWALSDEGKTLTITTTRTTRRGDEATKQIFTRR